MCHWTNLFHHARTCQVCAWVWCLVTAPTREKGAFNVFCWIKYFLRHVGAWRAINTKLLLWSRSGAVRRQLQQCGGVWFVQRLRPTPKLERATEWRKLPLLSTWVLFRECLWKEEFSMACTLSARSSLPREQAPSCAVNKKLAHHICKSFMKTGMMSCAHNRVAIRSVDSN